MKVISTSIYLFQLWVIPVNEADGKKEEQRDLWEKTFYFIHYSLRIIGVP